MLGAHDPRDSFEILLEGHGSGWEPEAQVLYSTNSTKEVTPSDGHHFILLRGDSSIQILSTRHLWNTCIYTIVIQLLYIFLGHVKLRFWVVCLQSNCRNFWVGNLIIIAVYPQLVGVWSLTINQTNQPKFRAQVLRRLRILKKNFVSWWNLRMRCPEKDCLNELFLDFARCFCFCEKWKCRHVIWLGFWESLRSFFCLLALYWHCNKWDWRFLKVHISSFLVVGDLFSDSAIIFLGDLLQFLIDPFSLQTFWDIQIAIFFAGAIGREGEEGSGL